MTVDPHSNRAAVVIANGSGTEVVQKGGDARATRHEKFETVRRTI